VLDCGIGVGNKYGCSVQHHFLKCLLDMLYKRVQLKGVEDAESYQIVSLTFSSSASKELVGSSNSKIGGFL